jgi:hypothetical protein
MKTRREEKCPEDGHELGWTSHVSKQGNEDGERVRGLHGMSGPACPEARCGGGGSVKGAKQCFGIGIYVVHETRRNHRQSSFRRSKFDGCAASPEN